MIIDGQNYVYNGTTWEELRRPNIIKAVATSVVANNASFTLWTPAAGKTINLMGLSIANICGTGAAYTLGFQFYDGATLIGVISIFFDPNIIVFPNNGILFSVANNILTVKNVSGGEQAVGGFAWGYET